MTTGGGLILALVSAFALNWGWLAQHGAASELPPLSLRRPLASLRFLFGDRTWLVGFLAGLAGWLLYVAALGLAPLSLVQATAAGGIGFLAVLAYRRGDRLERHDWTAVTLGMLGLALIGLSLIGGSTRSAAASPTAIAVWLAVSVAVAGSSAPLRAGVAAGLFYAAGDVATKGAVFGGGWLVLVPVVLAAHGAAFAVLQLGFQRAGALATAGTASLLTNAVPIVAGVALFHEHLPGGALGAARMIAFACVVVAAATLARRQDLLTAPA